MNTSRPTSELTSQALPATSRAPNDEPERAEAAFRDTEELYRQAIANAGAVPYSYEFKTGGYFYMGEGIERLIGYPPAEVNRSLWRRIIKESVMQGEAAGLDKEEAARRSAAGEFRYWKCDMLVTTRQGKRRWISDASAQSLDAQGKPIGTIGILQDITERKRAEMLTAASSKLGQDLSAATTPEAAAQIIGRAADELIGWDAFCLCLYSAEKDTISSVFQVDTINGERVNLPGFFSEQLSGSDRRVIQNGAELVLKEGLVVMAPESAPFGDVSRPSASIIRLPVRRGSRVVAILSVHSYTLNAYDDRDLRTVITLADQCAGALERIEAEMALRKSESQFRLVWETSQDGMRLTDSRGLMVMVNEAFCRMVKKSKQELEGKCFSTVHQADLAESLREQYQRLFASKAFDSHSERQVNLWNGETFWWELSNSFLELPGQGALLLSTFRDTTQRKQVELQLLRAQRMESIGTMASGIAHDLNNILAPITIAAQILRMKPLDEETEQMLGRIEASAHRGAEVVRQVLTFARGVEGERVSLQTRHLIREVAKIIKETFPKTITISQEAGGDLWPITGDATQLHQVLLNLCVNARDAMPTGGSLSLTAANILLEDAAFMMQGAKAGPYIVIQVKDTGTGIPAAIMGRIFEPFFTTKELGKGTGLGLSTVLGIVKSHGGCVNVYSEPGNGTTFKIYLPATPNATTLHTPQELNGAPGGRGELILVVDDEPGIRDVTRRILVKSGYRVLVAADGAEGVAMFTQHQGKIGLVLTDMMMPRMEGLALIRAVKKMQPEIKVIACSGLESKMGQSDRSEELKALGVHDFLSKPFTAESLLVLLNSVIGPR